MKHSVTVLGLGAVGLPVANALAKGLVCDMRLHSVAASTMASATRKLRSIGVDVRVVDLTDLESMGSLVVECLPPDLFRDIAGRVLRSGRSLLVTSVGGLLRHPEILAVANAGPGSILLPSGALGGLDAVRSIARHPQASVRLLSSKPPTGFEQSVYLTSKGIKLAHLTKRTCLFDGSATDGVRLFPKNVNVVAALALAGIGQEATHLSIWADPALTANTHLVEAKCPTSSFRAEITNLPDPANPRTSAITASSLLATLENFQRGWRFL